MEQYELAPRKIYSDLVYCIKNYSLDGIFVRLRGSAGGDVKLDQDLKGKKVTVKNASNGLVVVVNDEKIFTYEKDKTWPLRFSISYKRFPRTRYRSSQDRVTNAELANVGQSPVTEGAEETGVLYCWR